MWPLSPGRGGEGRGGEGVGGGGGGTVKAISGLPIPLPLCPV